MLGGKDQVGRAVERVGAGGEDGDEGIVFLIVGGRESGDVDFKIDFCADAAADPVALHFLQRFGPIEQFQIGQQASA